MRSRTVSLPSSCWRATLSAPPICSAVGLEAPQLVDLGLPASSVEGHRSEPGTATGRRYGDAMRSAAASRGRAGRRARWVWRSPTPRSSPSPSPTSTPSSTRRSSACRGCSRRTRSPSRSPPSRSPLLHRRRAARCRSSSPAPRCSPWRRSSPAFAGSLDVLLAARCGQGVGADAAARRVAARARRDRRRRGPGPSMVGDGRRRRRGHRPGARRRADRAVRLAGDLLRPGADRRRRARRRRSDPAARALRREGHVPRRGRAPRRRDVVDRQRRVRPRVRRPRRRAVPRRAAGDRGVALQPDPVSAVLVSALPLGMAPRAARQGAPRRRWSPSAAPCCWPSGSSGWPCCPASSRSMAAARVRALRRRLRPRARGARRVPPSRPTARPVRAGAVIGRRPPRRARARAGAHRPGAVVQPRRRHRPGDARRDPDDADHRAAAARQAAR